MSDRYQDFVSSPVGRLMVKNLGLPHPVPLDRYVAGSPLVDGTVVVGGTGRLVESLREALKVQRRRVATKPSAASKQRRLDAKKRRSQVKRLRGSPRHDN